jgi:hypothetical protein
MMASNTTTNFLGNPQIGTGAPHNILAVLHGQPASLANYSGGGEWFVDTSASSHMVTHPGISYC